MCVYHQVQHWLGFDLPPIEYGWDLVNGQFQPVLTCQPPAPDNLLNLISCNYKAGCERGCRCRKAGIQCLLLCVHCHGGGCNNSANPEADEEADHGLTGECLSEQTSELGQSTSGNYAEDHIYVQATNLACSDIHSEEPIATTSAHSQNIKGMHKRKLHSD